MAGIGDQGHRVRHKSKPTFDDHEYQVQAHGDGHSSIDGLGRYSVRMRMAMCMVVPDMIVLFHSAHLTSLAQGSA
jgi:hypothetical protein